MKTNSLVGELLINGVDAWTKFGVFLAEESIDGRANFNALLRPAATKKHVSVNLREEDGERLSSHLIPRSEGRDIELQFAVVAQSFADVIKRYRLFCSYLKSGEGDGWLILYVRPLDLTLKVYYKDCTALSTPVAYGEQRMAAICNFIFREPKPSI